MLLLALLVIFVALLAGALIVSKGELVSPSVLFCAGFTLSALFACAYQGAWGLDLHVNTFLVLALGVAFFVLCCLLCRVAMGRMGLFRAGEATDAWIVPVRPLPVVCYLVLQVVVFVATLIAIQGFFPRLSLSAAISAFNNASTFGTNGPTFSSLLAHARSLCLGGSFFVAYLLGQECAKGVSRKTLLVAAAFVLSLAIAFETGGRTSGVSFVFCSFVSFFAVKKRLEPNWKTFSYKTLIALVASAVIVMALFKYLAVGRGVSDRNTFDYLALYLGAEISNLDHFLQANWAPDNILFGQMTFVRDYNYLGTKLGIEEWIYPLDLPFLKSNGYSMGNVYTTFYAFIYDFGYWGIPFLVLVMSVISEVVYGLATMSGKTRWASIWVMLYAFIGFALFMSFFSNKFYEDILSVNFVRLMAYAILVRYVLGYFSANGIVARVSAFVKAKRKAS